MNFTFQVDMEGLELNWTELKADFRERTVDPAISERGRPHDFKERLTSERGRLQREADHATSERTVNPTTSRRGHPCDFKERTTMWLQREADHELKKIASSGERFRSRGKWSVNVFEYILSRRSSTWWSTPSELRFFFESKECLARKLKKIAYVSLSGEMKSECIRIYISRRSSMCRSTPSELCFFLRAKNA